MMFWILMAILILVAVIFVAPALLRKQQLAELDRNAQNVSIARERLDEIAAEHASGAMTDEVFEETKMELEASLIDDVSSSESQPAPVVHGGNYGRNVLIALAIIVPLATILLYERLGSPEFLELSGANAGNTSDPHQMAEGTATVEELAEKLRQRLEKNPDDAEGWFLLSKTYMSQQRYSDALAALQESHRIFGDHPTILLGLADASAMVKGGDLSGEPTEYIEKALQMAPDNTTGLWLGGMAAQQSGKYQLALDRWAKLVPKLQTEPDSQREVQSLIAETQRLAKQAGVEVTTPEIAMPAGKSIRVKVALDAAIAQQVGADKTVYVFAKAASGPPMPLAAYKTKVADLPLEVTLDDSMAMMPQMKLSAIDEVVVSARVSMSGQPVAQAGDYSSKQVKIPLLENSQVNLTIDVLVENPADIPLVEQTAALTSNQTAAAQTAPAPTATAPSVKVWVSLAKDLQGQALPDDVVFVFAKAKSGPPMPLAAFKTKVRELPMEVTLDDSLAMMPQMRISAFDEVVVSARVSRSGQPTAQPGDLASDAQAVKLAGGVVGLELPISQVVQ